MHSSVRDAPRELTAITNRFHLLRQREGSRVEGIRAGTAVGSPERGINYENSECQK